MYQAVTAPEIEGIRRRDTKRWEHPEGDTEAGLGQVIERSQFENLPMVDAPSIVGSNENETPRRQDADVYFDRWLVKDGETVWHGKPLAEVVIHGTVVRVTSYLSGFVVGLVDWQEGDRIEPGQIMANLTTRFDQGSRKTGLNPKPSAAMYFNRNGHFRL
jgi:hypothetical protein